MTDTGEPAEDPDFRERARRTTRERLPVIRDFVIPDRDRRKNMFDGLIVNIASAVLLYWLARAAGILPGSERSETLALGLKVSGGASLSLVVLLGIMSAFDHRFTGPKGESFLVLAGCLTLLLVVTGGILILTVLLIYLLGL